MRFLRPLSTQEWTSPQCRCLGYQCPRVSRGPTKGSSSTLESSTSSPRCFANSPHLPWLTDITAKVNPMPYTGPMRSPHTIIPVIACIICREYWLSAASCQPNVLPQDWSSEASCAESVHVMSKPFSLQCHATLFGCRLHFGSMRFDKWSHFNNGCLPIFQVS